MNPKTEEPPLEASAAQAPEAPPQEEQAEDGQAALMLAPEDYPNIDHLVTEDGKPLENFFVEREQRLLVDTLYASWAGPGEGQPFLAAANVGLFNVVANPAIVPDLLLSKNVKAPKDVTRKEGRSYFLWMFGKPPDLVLEIVSDRRGGEMTHKLRKYAEMKVGYYVVFDPDQHLDGGVLRAFWLCHGRYEPLDPSWLPGLALGLTFWEGTYEGVAARWLRWCDHDGHVLLSGTERAEQERQRAEQERQRAEQALQELQQGRDEIERLKAQLRALGHDPSA